MPAASLRRNPASCGPKLSASWRRSGWPSASLLLRQAHIVTAARAELRREHADAGAVTQLVDLVEQVGDVEPHGGGLIVRRPADIVRDAGVDRSARGPAIRRSAVRYRRSYPR